MDRQTEQIRLPRSLSILTGQVATPGQVADAQARARVFERYRKDKSRHTRRRQLADLDSFAAYLTEVEVITTGQALAHDPAAWQGVTWGLVENWLDWLLEAGYAVGTVNIRLSTVKTYAKLATKAGSLPPEQYALIRAVEGYTYKARRHVDEDRRRANQATRRGRKKAGPVHLAKAQARALKKQPDTPQGRRDALIMCLLLDHGLRCGEVAHLVVTDLDLKAGELRFYRPKVDKTQRHTLTGDTARAARRYIERDALAIGPLLRGSRKGGQLTEAGMSPQAITARAQGLGQALGLEGLSAHDCRHYWATQAARSGTDPFSLQEAGGWSSLTMPRRYVEAARIANEGVRLE